MYTDQNQAKITHFNAAFVLRLAMLFTSKDKRISTAICKSLKNEENEHKPMIELCFICEKLVIKLAPWGNQVYIPSPLPKF